MNWRGKREGWLHLPPPERRDQTGDEGIWKIYPTPPHPSHGTSQQEVKAIRARGRKESQAGCLNKKEGHSHNNGGCQKKIDISVFFFSLQKKDEDRHNLEGGKKHEERERFTKSKNKNFQREREKERERERERGESEAKLIGKGGRRWESDAVPKFSHLAFA